MDESVGDGGGGGSVVEEFSPVFESEVGGDDGGGAEVTFVEDLVEEVGTSGVEAEVAEFVDKQQVGCGPCGKASMQGVLFLSPKSPKATHPFRTI